MDGSTRDGRDPVAIAAVWQRLFGDVSDDAIAAVNTRVEWVELHGGAYLMRQGDEADRAYILVRGRLRAVVDGGEDGPRVVGEISPGEIVGEMALMTGQPRSASVYAIRDSLLACLSRSSFESLIDSHPEMVIGLSRVLVRRLERSLHGRQVPTEVCNIAILLPRPSPAAEQFIDRLVVTLERYGPTLRLDRRTVVERLRAQSVLADPDGATDADGNTLVPWLDEQERSHRFVVYVADPGASGWSRRCVRQADRVMLVSGAAEDPARARSWRSRRDHRVLWPSLAASLSWSTKTETRSPGIRVAGSRTGNCNASTTSDWTARGTS
jgi:NTE family protein